MARFGVGLNAKQELIDDAPEDVMRKDVMRKRRMEAVERLANLNAERPLDVPALSRILEGAYEPGGVNAAAR